MTWTRLACAALVVALLQAPRASALRSVREKQVKLEDIERDNLQSELIKQQRPAAETPYHHHQHHHHQQQQQQQHQQEQEPEQAYHPQNYHPQQHFRYEQQQPQQHLPSQHTHLQRPHLQQHLQQQQQHLLYQTAAPAAPVVPTHVMYLLMPNGNVAAFQLAPHPNHLQAYYTPSGKAHLMQPQASLGTLFHQHAMAYLQQQQQPLAHPLAQQVQYVPAAQPLAQPLAHPQQRYHPTVHHQPTLAFNSPQAHQLHAQHFRELAAEPSPSAGLASAGPEISTYGQPAEQPQQPTVQQSHKSLFGAGVKATASPPLKGSFSTQTGQSYANFRQYG